MASALRRVTAARRHGRPTGEANGPTHPHEHLASGDLTDAATATNNFVIQLHFTERATNSARSRKHPLCACNWRKPMAPVVAIIRMLKGARHRLDQLSMGYGRHRPLGHAVRIAPYITSVGMAVRPSKKAYGALCLSRPAATFLHGYGSAKNLQWLPVRVEDRSAKVLANPAG